MRSLGNLPGNDVSSLEEDPPEGRSTTRVEPTFEDSAETPCSSSLWVGVIIV